MRYAKRSKEEMDQMSDEQLLDALHAGQHVDPDVIQYLKHERPALLMDHLLDQMNDPNVTIGPVARRWMKKHAEREGEG